jgi:hypothetical protein
VRGAGLEIDRRGASLQSLGSSGQMRMRRQARPVNEDARRSDAWRSRLVFRQAKILAREPHPFLHWQVKLAGSARDSCHCFAGKSAFHPGQPRRDSRPRFNAVLKQIRQDRVSASSSRKQMDVHDTIRLLVHLRNSPDLKLRAIVRELIRADIRKARLSSTAFASFRGTQRRPHSRSAGGRFSAASWRSMPST